MLLCRYELHHGVRINDTALVEAAIMSDRYIADRFLPDKAIDLIDEAAAKLKMEITSKPLHLDEIDRKVQAYTGILLVKQLTGSAWPCTAANSLSVRSLHMHMAWKWAPVTDNIGKSLCTHCSAMHAVWSQATSIAARPVLAILSWSW